MSGDRPDNIEIARSLLRAVEAGDSETLRALLVDDFGKVSATTGKWIGRDEWLTAHEDLHRSLPDLRFNPRDFRVEGDKVTATIEMTARNTEPVRLPQLGIDLPATGIELSAPPHTDTFTIRDGKVVDIDTVIPPGGGLPSMFDQIRRAASKDRAP